MAKTIMIANDVYTELKNRKGNNSFSELLTSLMSNDKKKTGADIFLFYGALENDKEFDNMKKEREKGWTNWTRKYA